LEAGDAGTTAASAPGSAGSSLCVRRAAHPDVSRVPEWRSDYDRGTRSLATLQNVWGDAKMIDTFWTGMPTSPPVPGTYVVLLPSEEQAFVKFTGTGTYWYSDGKVFEVDGPTLWCGPFDKPDPSTAGISAGLLYSA
jgi:hypothetical protein